jgi:microcin C transport system ATP-binding protein
MSDEFLSVKDLSVFFKTPSGSVTAVDGVSFDIKKGQTVALVGESGSGKSVTALSIMKLLPYPLVSHSPASSILFQEQDILSLPDKEVRHLRGERISMIFQEPQTALNPLHTIERQISEMLILHRKYTKENAKARTLELLDLVGLEKLKTRLNAYPHELSGGQRQRVMIAMALANEPDLLIADEPTTALDVTIQAQILELLNSLKEKLDMALLLITHDLTIVEKMADHVCVMQQGKIVEQKKTKELFATPEHPYTKALLNAQPGGAPDAIPETAPIILKTDNLNVRFPVKTGLWGQAKEYVHAVNNISLDLKQGETLGIVGESGSGKTTLGLALLKLIRGEGAITFNGQDLTDYNRKAMRSLRSDMQVVFQDPYSSLSPRMSVARIIGEGLEIHRKDLNADQKEALIIKALEDVHMDPEVRHRYPHEFSGGQRQRISIARAMILEPKLVVLDEPTSALDVSIQCEIVELLKELQRKKNLSYLFISHDLRVVRAMAHRIMVMKNGKIVEAGASEDILERPKEEYTINLIDAALNLKASRQPHLDQPR